MNEPTPTAPLPAWVRAIQPTTEADRERAVREMAEIRRRVRAELGLPPPREDREDALPGAVSPAASAERLEALCAMEWHDGMATFYRYEEVQ